MNEFTVHHLVSSASMNIFPQNTFSSSKNFFNEEVYLEGEWRVALGEIIFPVKKIKWTKVIWRYFVLKSLSFLRKPLF